METDARYYRRRAREEFAAASRAVTQAALERRLQLLESYLVRLDAMGEPWPLHRDEVRRMFNMGTSRPASAMGWDRQTKKALLTLS